MKRKKTGLAAVALALASVSAAAQEHWTEGPVWQCDAYRTSPGQFDAYMKYIRSTVEPQTIEAKKQGLILDSKTFVKAPSDANDYDVLFCTLYANFGKALDYSKEDEDKSDAISAAHFATEDEDKQADIIKPRLEMRKYLGTTYVREVTLRPIG